MSKLYVIGDMHLGHRNILKYRPFSSIKEHDATLIDNYNNIVTKRDTVLFLGDIVFTYEHLKTIKELVGRKVLIQGNHDLDVGDNDKRRLWEAFDDVKALYSKANIWYSHAPIHPDELRGKFNIHGHCHNHIIDDPRYFNASAEQINYTPKHVEEIKEILNERNKGN